MTQLSGEINVQSLVSGDVSSRPILNVGLTDDVKQALLTIAQKVAYIDEHGQDYYNALYSALYPPAVLLSIDAVFAQGSAVIYDSDSLDVLRQYLIVTGLFDDYTTDTIQGYSLSGTLTAGTSTITVSYGGKTTTFGVEVTHRVWAVTSIDAVFTQGSAVIYDNDPLDVLREYLVVTATYENESTAVVTSYSLSGTLTVGTSTITASFGGKSDTFAVSVTQHVVVLVSISAVFTQGDSVVYDTDSLDTLKQYLVVTATYADSTTETVSDYTLSGTLEVGTSTITVSYGGKTDTFSVTVTDHSIASILYKWENLGLSLTDSKSGIVAETTGTQTPANNCILFNAASKYIDFGEIYAYDRTYVIEFGASASTNTSGHARFFGVDTDSDTSAGGSVFAYRGNRGFCFYTGSWGNTLISGTDKRNIFANSELRIYVDSSGKAHAYKDGTFLGSTSGVFKATASGLRVYIGGSNNDYLATIEIKSMVVYSGEAV